MVCAAAMGFQTARRSDFSGTWKLDLKKSKNLPAAFQSVEGYTMKVTQDDDSLVAVVQMEGSGQKTSLPPLVCRFGHKDDYTEDQLRFAKHWISSEWTAPGTKLIVHKKNALTLGGKVQNSTETDVWQLKNKSTLQISVTVKSDEDGTVRSEQRIFHRAK